MDGLSIRAGRRAHRNLRPDTNNRLSTGAQAVWSKRFNAIAGYPTTILGCEALWGATASGKQQRSSLTHHQPFNRMALVDRF